MKALIIHPVLKGINDDQPLDYMVEEAGGLARAIALEIIAIETVNVPRIQAGAFFGKGQRERFHDVIATHNPNVVIVNHTLSPVQQRNLEKEWGGKVIDRTGLILEIFSARAQTKEGGLQVELAALQYQRSRLVRTWTHLERQRGATGFVGGPGETQIEIDRRLIGERITKLKKELEKVRRTRQLAQKGRAKTPVPTVALVGYTNAGKSTLFNYITGAEVMAEDLLFATLDPTMRQITLPHNMNAVLSDTVGFISNLPTHLVEAFKATLEHINDADIIVHVQDISNPAHAGQADDVRGILNTLGIEKDDPRIFDVYNKIDRVSDVEMLTKRAENHYPLSAVTGQGVEAFLDGLSAFLQHDYVTRDIDLTHDTGKKRAWLYEHGDVLKTNKNTLTVRLSQANAGRFDAL